MAKKLLTSNHALVVQVENVLKEKGIPCAWVNLGKETDMFMLVVLNRHGEEMRKAISECPVLNKQVKYYFGVLRHHPEYTVPRGILKELNDEEK